MTRFNIKYFIKGCISQPQKLVVLILYRISTRAGTPQPLLTEATTASKNNDSIISKMDEVIQEYKDAFTKYSVNYSDQEMI
ncbi:unnamed protein product [Oikopleura dioica]|uniref:Uncharacterized protein n=1 Tax=Oikopleura dioica TaxID=34765 RepID=E4WRJ6_OIKDI|nr:unnamed protein product [Oikopleura dioica]CBY36143.1 unnamed protein product [Oikopleura dioica]